MNTGQTRFAGKHDVKRWLDTLFKSPFVVVDFETTDGVNKDASGNKVYPEPVSIAVLDSNGTELAKRYIKPKGAISPGAFAVHGITEEQVASALGFGQTLVLLSASGILERRMVAYNAGFEWGVFHGEVARDPLMKRYVPNAIDCAMLAYAAWDGTPNAWNNGHKWHKLTDACEAMGIPVLDAHDAMGDCKMTLQLLGAMRDA